MAEQHTAHGQPQNADAPRPDSMGKMLRRLAAPAHVVDLARRSVQTLQQQGAEQLWRDVRFKVGLAMHIDRWQHRADIPLRRTLKQQREKPIVDGPKFSIIVPLYNTPAKLFDEMLQSVQRQTYPNWQLVLVDGSEDNRLSQRIPRKTIRPQSEILWQKIENKGIAANTNEGFALATGDYITLLDHDDVLYPNALYEMAQAIQSTGAQLLYSDEIILSADLKQLGGYHFKPDFAPDFLNGCNYITHLCVFSRALLEKAGGREHSEFDGAQDHDLILRLTEALDSPAQVYHIPKVLYVWRAAKGSTAAGIAEAKPYALQAGARAVEAHLQRIGRPAAVTPVEGAPGAFAVRYELAESPKVSVIIPSKDHTDDLERCLSSLYAHAGYENFEVLVVENNSTNPATEEYYAALPQKYPTARVLRYQGGFNFSAINNFARREAAGEYLLLLNNDIEVLSDRFLPELLSYATRPDVGAVGAKLFYPDDTIQHAGVILGINGTAGHSHKSYRRDAVGDLYRLVTAQNYLAVTGACLMVKASLYDAVGGLDEGDFAVAYNDVDLCLKLHERGLWNVYTPLAQCYHYESKSRGLDDGSAASAANQARYAREKAAFQARWGKYLPEGADPFYNIHFNNLFENFGLK